ncbi:uncharacterized protein METZ01_LOCUS49853 [marine metagenome]|uniref:Enoyl-CoA hydratase n=1 Tax=marine metagenome TaxID=408172 RepID=A0A381S0U2_9ZZZZ
MEFETVIYEVDNKVATITLNRPDNLNAFNSQMVLDLREATDATYKDSSIRCVILTGKGKGFSAGADLKENMTQPNDPNAVEKGLLEGYKPVFMNIINMPKPVISAVNGPAAGIGYSFAMACDLTLMSEEAYLLSAFSNIGVVPDGGANWMLTNTVGYKLAYQLAIEGEKIPASRCLELGLVNKVVPSDELLSEAKEWATKLSQRSPQALSQTKKIMRMALDSTFEEIFSVEAKIQNQLIGSADNKEAVMAFLEKRPPKFQD